MSAFSSATISTASLAPKSLSRSTLPVTPTLILSQPRASSQGFKVQARVLSTMVNWLPNFGSKSTTEVSLWPSVIRLGRLFSIMHVNGVNLITPCLV